MLTIKLAHGNDAERLTQKQLESLLDIYDLSPWFFTDQILIDSTSLPHSHPVLTLHTRHLNQDFQLLSTFLHEQLHWYLESKSGVTDAAVTELRRMYPSVPVGFPEGGETEDSTYLHLLVNYLEWQSLRHLVGEQLARDMMKFWSNDHYTWIYQTVLKDANLLKEVVERYELALKLVHK